MLENGLGLLDFLILTLSLGCTRGVRPKLLVARGVLGDTPMLAGGVALPIASRLGGNLAGSTRPGWLRRATLTTTAAISTASDIMISPTLKRSEFPSPNTRLLSLPPVESALAPAHVKQPYGRSADEQRHHSGHGEEGGEATCVG